jgi:hypothetical protein
MDFPIPSGDVTNSNSPWPGIIKLIPPMERLVTDIPAGDWKNDNLFFDNVLYYCKVYVGRELYCKYKLIGFPA